MSTTSKTTDAARALELLKSDYVQSNKFRMGALAVADIDSAVQFVGSSAEVQSELLEALQKCVTYIDHHCPDVHAEGLVNECRAAIAKATQP